MKLQLSIIALSLTLASASAQNGIIDKNELEQIRSSYNQDVSTKAIRNAIQSNSNLKTLSLDCDVENSFNHTFKYEAKLNKTITDQHSSGRCWMFTSMNVLRPQLAEHFNLNSFNFSQNFNYFWDIFEKSNLFLENIIDSKDQPIDDRQVVVYFSSPIDDGGVWNHFYNISKKYGVVPAEVMPETVHSNATSSMMSIIKERLRKGGMDIRNANDNKAKAAEIEDIKIATLKDIYRTLALCLGEPPVVFDWHYTDKDGNAQVIKDYTPEQFFTDIVPENYTPQSYIMTMNDPTRPYYKVYDIENYRNTQEGANWVFLNLPAEDLKAAALKSIKAGESMYISCDVGKQLNSKAGKMAMGMYDVESLLGIDLSMDKRSRILSRQSGSSHAMTLMACDTDEDDKPTKWRVENSWGDSSGDKGYLTFTDEWFDNYIFRVVVKSEYLDQKAKKALSQEVVKLPIWDYMF
ncbi:MAG: C1 family peptidase [Rikenellaceae bacterium]